ncbi:MAG: hypothetical protein JXA71_08175 [Chitinispirillaceae bacterium]|nr:hypothetical protein [Chitinispirillaceae bacterium]
MNRTTIAVIGLIFLSYLFIAHNMPRDAFWIIDSGNRYIQMKNFLTGKSADFTISYPSRAIDSEYRFFPYYRHHFQIINGKTYAFFPPYYSLLMLPFYRLLGWIALDLVSILAGIGALLMVVLLIRKLDLPVDPLHQIVILAFATPLFFYHLVFWEHALTVLLALCGTWCLVPAPGTPAKKPALVVAGVLFGLVTVFREEGYVLFAVVITLSAFMAGRKTTVIPAVAGYLLVIIPLWLFQHSVFGHFLGVHALDFAQKDTEGAPLLSLQWITEKTTDFGIYLFQGHRNPLVCMLIALPLLGSVIFALFVKNPVRHPRVCCGILSATVVSGAVPMVLMMAAEDWVFNTLYTQGLFPTVPFLVLMIVCFRSLWALRERWIRISFLVCLTYLFCTMMLIHHKYIGIIWGPRFFLFLFPLMVSLALVGARHAVTAMSGSATKRLALACVIALFAESAMIQTFGIVTLQVKKNAGKTIVDTIRQTGSDVIVTDVFWFAEEAAVLFHEKKVLTIRSGEDYPRLFALLNEHRISRVTFFFSKKFSPTHPAMIDNILSNSPDKVSLSFKRAAMLDCTIAPVINRGFAK